MNDTNRITQVSLIAPLVDCQPAYNLISVITTPDAYPPTTVAFVRAKLRESAIEMRRTSEWIERKLAETDPCSTRESSEAKQ